jgi:hypothetical protein
MNMPMAAPIPPVHGPNRTAKTAGITAAGQKATPPKVRPKSVKRPTTAYTAAQTPIIATSNALIFNFAPSLQVLPPLFNAGFVNKTSL